MSHPRVNLLLMLNALHDQKGIEDHEEATDNTEEHDAVSFRFRLKSDPKTEYHIAARTHRTETKARAAHEDDYPEGDT